MKILFNINSDSELVCFESLSLAFVLATFDHHIQLRLGTGVLPVLSDPNSRFFGMLKSISLYDLPNAWVDEMAAFDDLPDEILTTLCPTPQSVLDNVDTSFDSILVG